MRCKDLDREVRNGAARFYAAGRESPGGDEPRSEALPWRHRHEVVTRDGIESLDYLFGTNKHAGREVLRRLRAASCP